MPSFFSSIYNLIPSFQENLQAFMLSISDRATNESVSLKYANIIKYINIYRHLNIIKGNLFGSTELDRGFVRFIQESESNDETLRRVKLFIERHGVNINPNPIWSPALPLHEAIRKQDYNLVKLLLDNGADPNTTKGAYGTPLNMAVRLDNRLIVELLIKYKANLEYKNANDDTYLHIAAKYASIAIAKVLLEQKIDINAVNKEHETALFEAIQADNLPMVKFLVDRGANISQVNKKGVTPFLLAITTEVMSPIIVKYLCQKDPNLATAKNQDGQSPAGLCHIFFNEFPQKYMIKSKFNEILKILCRYEKEQLDKIIDRDSNATKNLIPKGMKKEILNAMYMPPKEYRNDSNSTYLTIGIENKNNTR